MGRSKAPSEPWSQDQDEYLKNIFNQKASYEEIAEDFKAAFGVEKRKLLHYRNRLIALGVPKDLVHAIPARSAKTAKVQKPVAFDIEPVRSMKKGDVAFMPGIGPVRCTGFETITMQGGTELPPLLTLTQVHADREYTHSGSRPKSPITLRFAPQKLADKNLRKLFDLKTMEKILAYLEHGIAANKLPKMTSKRQIVLDDMFRSGQPQDLAEIMIHAYRPLSVDESRSGLDTDMANKAMHILASEYALSAKKPYEEARQAVRMRSGKKTMAQLDDFSANMPAAALG